MTSRFIHFFILVFSLATLAACQTTAADRRFSKLTYGHLAPFRLNAGILQVVSEYRSPMKSPNVEHLSPAPPETALRQWAGDRLSADGIVGTARFVILDASVKETPLTLGKGLKGAVTLDQSERFDATVEANLEIMDRGRRLGYATAKASRSITVREDASLNQREKVWFELSEMLMNDFNDEMEKNISLYLGKWIR